MGLQDLILRGIYNGFIEMSALALSVALIFLGFSAAIYFEDFIKIGIGILISFTGLVLHDRFFELKKKK